MVFLCPAEEDDSLHLVAQDGEDNFGSGAAHANFLCYRNGLETDYGLSGGPGDTRLAGQRYSV